MTNTKKSSKVIELPMLGSLNKVTDYIPCPNLVGAVGYGQAVYDEATKLVKQPLKYLRQALCLGECAIVWTGDRYLRGIHASSCRRTGLYRLLYLQHVRDTFQTCKWRKRLMTIENTIFLLKDDSVGTLCLPDATTENGKAMLRYLYQVSSETPYNGRSAEDVTLLTVEDQVAWLQKSLDSKDSISFVCVQNGQVIGSCEVELLPWKRCRHRARLALSVMKDYWGLGVGSAMLAHMLNILRGFNYIRQVELEVYETNTRARGLYEKYGFRLMSVQPDALQLDDGTMLDAYHMMCRL